MKKKLLALLALLTTIVSGAWADDTEVFSYTVASSHAKNGTNIAATGGTVDLSVNAVETKNNLLGAKFSGDGQYVKCTLSSGTLKTGDKITLKIFQNSTSSPDANTYGVTVVSAMSVTTFDGTVYVANATGKGLETGSFTVGSDLNGKSVFYVRRNSSSSVYFQAISITRADADTTKPTISLTTPASTTNVAISTQDVVLTVSEAVTKVGDNVTGTLKIGDAAASAINYVFDATENTLTYSFASDLDYSTTYAFTVDANQVQDAAENKNDETSAYSFTTEANTPASITSITPDGGAVNGGSSVTVVAEGSVKYQWTETADAPAIDGEGWSNGAIIEVPNVEGTRYLHVFATKAADNNSTVTTKAFTITKVGQTVTKIWDFTKPLSTADVTNLTADSKWTYDSGKKRWTGENAKWADKNTYISLTANSSIIEIVDGLSFARTSELKGTFIRIDVEKQFQLNGNNGLIKIPGLNAGDIVEIKFASAGSTEGDRSITASSNASLTSAEGSNVSNINTDIKTCQFTADADGDVVITNPDNGINFFYIKVYQTSPIKEVAMNQYEWTTFVSDKPLDFTNSDVKAYIVTGHTGSALNKTEVTKVAANTPLLLNAPEGTYNIPVSDSGTNYSSSNKLVAGTGAAVAKEDGKTKYVLSLDDNDNIAFLKINNDPATVPADKAYLEFNEVVAAPSFDFGDATAIDDVRSKTEDVRGDYYNLNGQRVANPTKGLYIVNGKKVIVK